MRWSVLGNIFLFASSVVFSQTYIIKFNTDGVDSTSVYSLVQQSLTNIKSQTNQAIAFSVKPFTQKSVSFKSNFPWQKYSVVRFSQKQSEQFLQSLASNSSVEYIQPSYTYKVYSIPNDSAYSSQWNLRRIGISSLWENGTINSLLPTVKIGVVDTGIDDDHPDLANSIAINSGETGIDLNGKNKRSNGIDDDSNGFIDDWRGYDFVDSESEDIGDWNERDNDPNDEHGHGTSVSGIIGAEANNGIGVTGILPCKILPLRAFGKNGSGNDIDIASAIVYAVDNGIDVINMSFGDVVQSALLHDAIRYAYSRNIVLVASSGNDGSNYPHYPSDFSEVISTGSVGQFDSRSFFSSYSPSLDVMAPGEEIVTTTIGRRFDLLSGGYTNSFSGTSAAAPHVAGVSALLKSLEKQKKISNPNYVELSNEEIRGILLNSADDVGEKGWDKFYGAGIVNAARAIQAVSGSNVVIHSPKLDEILPNNFNNIVVTASTPYLKSVQLYYGQGENPTEWKVIDEIENKILIRDTLRFLQKILLPNDIYILRLIVKNSKGNDIEFRQRVVIANSNPKILPFKFRDSVIIGNEYGALIEARVDRNSYGTLYYRKVGESNYKTIQSLGLQLNHSFVLTTKDFIPTVQYQVFCEFVENSVQKRSAKFYVTDSIGAPLVFSSQTISTTGFVKKTYSLPKGFLLNAVHTMNGKSNLILNEYNGDNDFGKLKAFEFNGNIFSIKDSSVRSWVPRSFIKNSGEGKPAILVQDRGISQLLQIDTANGKFFSQPIWGDSTDVWSSQIIDVDGDNKPEIIARSSSEYLIYKNLGNNNFSLQTRLPNPSLPLFSEARNQFGPPKSIIGDFTNSGRKEIIFADFDGDVIMYRQTAANSLNFELAGIDTSDLFEMSDYITSGDFNGDGILDFAVAGHSNLDWNKDREYDVSVWTVRVFSHLLTDASGKVFKIWEQHFVGVKAGSGYDNGLMSGKLKTNDTTDALFISFNPQLYVFEWNAVKNTFESKWIHSSQSNSAIIYDFDNDSFNDIGFHTNGKTEFWSLQSNLITSAPFGLTAVPISATKINLRWSSSTTSHKIYRWTHPDSLNVIPIMNGNPEWIDSTVSLNIKYYYAVTAVGNNESPKSAIVSVIPHNAPLISSVTQVSLSQLSVGLSFDVSSGNLLTTVFVLDSTIKSSSVVWKSSRSVMVTFPQIVSVGNHTLKIQQLTDASGMAGDTTQAFPFAAILKQENEFFVRSIKLLSSNKIQIEFSEQPNIVLAKEPSNYSVKTIAKQFTVFSVGYDSTQPMFVNLNLSSGTNLSELALRLEVTVSENITSLLGVKLNAGKGQVLSIAQETQSIDNIVVYPNPVKNSQQVSFVNIPANCKITIYSVNGEKIKVFADVTTNEGISWNLRDELGNIVSTGIYLYRVEQLNISNEVSNTKLGKFAVIR